MDTRFLESLLAVVDTGTIAAAARRQKLTPAAVSLRLRALEQALGQPLLARSAHAARPTEACLAMLPRVRRILREVAALPGDLAGTALIGEVRVGVIATALAGLFPAVLDHLARSAPGLRLRLVPGASAELYEQMVAERLDAAVIVTPPFALPKSLRAEALWREEPVLLAPASSHGADAPAILSSTPFLRYDLASWGGRIMGDYMRAAGLQPDIRCDMDAPETIAVMVARGMGCSILPAWMGMMQMLPEGLRRIALPDAARHARPVCFLAPASAGSAGVAALREAVQAAVIAQGPPG